LPLFETGPWGQLFHNHIINIKEPLTLGTTDVSRLVSPEEFAAAMTRRWHSLGNTSSTKLQQLWKTMAATFTAAATNPFDTKWRVLEPPTGTGKTQGLCVYAALTIANNRTSASPLGILVVTRTIAQANEIVATIKELLADAADADKVLTKHCENKLHVFSMQAAEVLIITHAAYTRALEGLCKEQYGRWEDYATWTHGPRCLTIIDEALSGVVEHNQLTADDIQLALSFVDPALRLAFPSQVQALETMRDILDKIAELNASHADADKVATSARIVWRGVRDGRLKFPPARRAWRMRRDRP
jgi:hypothetical protein